MMLTRGAAGVLAVLAILPALWAASDAAAVKGELARFQGTWVEVDFDTGKPRETPTVVVIQGNRLILREYDENQRCQKPEVAATFAVDVAKQQITINLPKRETIVADYTFQGGKLTIASDQRPFGSLTLKPAEVGQAILDAAGGPDIVFSPNSKYLALNVLIKHPAEPGQPAKADSFIHIRDASTGEVLRTIDGSGTLVFSPDNRLLAAGHSAGVDVWEVATGKLVMKGVHVSDGAVSCQVQFSPDGRRLVATRQASPGVFGGPYNVVKIWKIAD